MALIIAALGFGFLFVDSYDGVLAMGVLLGIAGASFGVALSLGSGWYPPKYKGLAMGIAGAGNSGTVLAVLLAPPLAQAYGWQTVYGLAAGTMLLPMAVMWFCAKEPPDREHQTLRGIATLSGVLCAVAVTLAACGFAGTSLAVTTLLFMLCFAALGAGNGALFQLVPLRWPLTTAVAGSMIGEIGALGGGFLPNAMGLSKQFSGSYLWGFLSFTVMALAMLAMLRVMQIRWTRTWAEKGGKARSAPTAQDFTEGEVQRVARAQPKAAS